MRSRVKSIIVTLLSLSLIFLLPCLLVILLSSKEFTDLLTNTLAITNSEFIEICISYFSLAISLLLGVIVYFQSQRINELEITQYSTFLGVQEVDYSADLGNMVFSEEKRCGFWISHSFTSDKKVILAGVNILRKGSAKSIVVPLVFVTKNQPLIVSLDFQKVTVKLMHCGKELCNRTFENDNEPIYALLSNESQFILGFGMLVSDEWEVDEINLVFQIDVKDQNRIGKKIESIVTLHKFGQRPGYYLTSSRTR